MNLIDKRIISFIKNHHILTLATINEKGPYCCTCFYVYLEEQNFFIFTSEENTKHVKDIREKNLTAGAIALETSMVGKIKGIQFTGITEVLTGNQLVLAKKIYLKKFPIARLSNLQLWKMEPDFIKMTDNQFGFGKKLIWYK